LLIFLKILSSLKPYLQFDSNKFITIRVG